MARYTPRPAGQQSCQQSFLTHLDGGTDDGRGASGGGGEDKTAGMATGWIVSCASPCEADQIGMTEDPDDCGSLGRLSVTAPRLELVDGLVGVTIAECVS